MTSSEDLGPPIPKHVLDQLLCPFIQDTADRMIEFFGKDNLSERLLTPGDPFAEVMTWLWRSNPDKAVDVVIAYLDRVAAATDGCLECEHVLSGVRSIRDHFLTTGEVDELIEQTRIKLHARP